MRVNQAGFVERAEVSVKEFAEQLPSSLFHVGLSQLNHISEGELVYIASDYANDSAEKGSAYAFQGPDGQRNLGTINFEDSAEWEKIDPLNIEDWLPPGINLNISSSDSTAVGGLIVLNDLRGSVAGFIDNADVDVGGTVSIAVQERATITATNTSVASADGGRCGGQPQHDDHAG